MATSTLPSWYLSTKNWPPSTADSDSLLSLHGSHLHVGFMPIVMPSCNGIFCGCLLVNIVCTSKVYFMEVLQVIIGFVFALIEKARKSPFVIVPQKCLLEHSFVCKFTDQFSVLICHCQMVVDCELTQFFLVFIFFLFRIDRVLDWAKNVYQMT